MLSEVVAGLRINRPKNVSCCGTLEGNTAVVKGTAPPKLSMKRKVLPSCRLQLARNSLFIVALINQLAPAVRVRVLNRVGLGLLSWVPPRWVMFSDGE